MAASRVKLKLLFDSKSKKVLFAEAGKDFVDFLFYLLSLPVSTVVRLLKDEGEVGCLSDLYNSLENLNDTYIQPTQNKTDLLYHKSFLCGSEFPLLLSDSDQYSTRNVYMCPRSKSSYDIRHVSDVPNYMCPHCNEKMNVKISLVNSSSSAPPKSSDTSSTSSGNSTADGGFVKGVVTYMVMDNLEVKPMSTISSITLLNSFNVQNVGSLEEKVVALDVDEGLKLLKASLECKNVLSTVFLGDSVMRKGNCGSAIQSTGKVIGPKSRTKSGGMGLDTNMVMGQLRSPFEGIRCGVLNNSFSESPKRLSKVKTQTTLFLLSLATVAFFRRPSQFFLHLCSSSIRETSKTDMEASQVNLKLLIDTKSKKVLFAEAGKDFVDFLFYLLSLPVATVTKLLKEKGDVGCVTDLYKSLENLNQIYMQPNQNKTSLLNPKSPLNANGLPLLLSDNHDQSKTTARNLYLCGNSTHVSDVHNTKCPCGHRITRGLTFVSPATAVNSSTPAVTATEEGGFVRGMVTYMVMDNLEVKLMSTISAITLLNELNVKDVGSLKEKIVVLGVDEGLELLKASLECKNALTSVFLIATVTKLLKEKGDVGCLTDLYKSLENLNQTYMQPNQNKTLLLNPKSPLYANGIPLLLSDHQHQVPTSRKIYQCRYHSSHLADVPNFCCTLCGHYMTEELTLLNSPTDTTTVVDGGFVKGVVTYMVMDNLEVKPMSTISAITLLNEFNVKDVGSLKEKNVVLGEDEGLELLKASLECKNVLTSVFLCNIELE
ncbi:hypothetical protein LWI28_025439 [Acer negundo]|uniref:DUF674 domain-containing protein n=1 Tax=Acer negundo TaxID=4023 RepID=A0AAD5NI44_ACENE|nr:hypothetical protein LWI28_025439 [Acer negundo]